MATWRPAFAFCARTASHTRPQHSGTTRENSDALTCRLMTASGTLSSSWNWTACEVMGASARIARPQADGHEQETYKTKHANRRWLQQPASRKRFPAKPPVELEDYVGHHETPEPEQNNRHQCDEYHASPARHESRIRSTTV